MSSSASSAADIILKLRQRRQKIQDPTHENPTPTSITESSPVRTAYTDAQIKLADIDKQKKSCEDVLKKLKKAFSSHDDVTEPQHPRVLQWRDKVNGMVEKLGLPETVIAVVGMTGSGKSSLLNALTDHRKILPTSGLGACTSVVVEVRQNYKSTFEAEIEFKKKEEWFDELENQLLPSLCDEDGILKLESPDSKSDSYSSFCKIKAVYGKIDRFEILSQIDTVTQLLGSPEHIVEKKEEDFRQKIVKYIRTKDRSLKTSETSEEYWPIVNLVKIRIPDCNVCTGDAVFVDLPGVNDSNAARSKIAEKYLKKCDALWVVSHIQRAVDEKIARDLLDERFCQQVLMDGNDENIAFICTKTDDLDSDEIIE